MLRCILSAYTRSLPFISQKVPLVSCTPQRTYFPIRKLMKARGGKYYLDPDNGAERIVRVIGIHEHVKDPTKITLNSTLTELGLNDLDLVEICLGIENEFNIEFTDDQCESFKKVKDIVEAVITNQFADY